MTGWRTEYDVGSQVQFLFFAAWGSSWGNIARTGSFQIDYSSNESRGRIAILRRAGGRLRGLIIWNYLGLQFTSTLSASTEILLSTAGGLDITDPDLPQYRYR